ncbi:hypothetical protein SPRA44_550036 [Serratia proteamaculans]|nr:hypothetical protein SPRA44_550036 [Serratia proteamaculans]
MRWPTWVSLKEAHNPDELTQVSDSGERLQSTHLQLEV